jgi:predicted enzyme related to lactoylglutathione lyase
LASIALVNVTSNNIEQTRSSYGKLLGMELIPSLEDPGSFQAAISEDGVDLLVGPRRFSGETILVYFHVDDLDASLQAIVAQGGRVAWGPESMAMSDEAFRAFEAAYRREHPDGPPPSKELARAAVVQEPGGTHLGVLQINEYAHDHFRVGAYQQPITDKQLSHLQQGMEAAKKFKGDRAQ